MRYGGIGRSIAIGKRRRLEQERIDQERAEREAMPKLFEFKLFAGLNCRDTVEAQSIDIAWIIASKRYGNQITSVRGA